MSCNCKGKMPLSMQIRIQAASIAAGAMRSDDATASFRDYMDATLNFICADYPVADMVKAEHEASEQPSDASLTDATDSIFGSQRARYEQINDMPLAAALTRLREPIIDKLEASGFKHLVQIVQLSIAQFAAATSTQPLQNKLTGSELDSLYSALPDGLSFNMQAHAIQEWIVNGPSQQKDKAGLIRGAQAPR